jgi:hypothetical protein
MIPISHIKEGDQFQNPLFSDGVVFAVVETEKAEKMVKVQAYSFRTGKCINEPFWKKNTDRMFSELWRFGLRKGGTQKGQDLEDNK